MTNEEWIKAMRAGIPEEGEFPISSYDDLHPGRFLKCGHLKGEPRTLTIARYKGEKMGMKNGRPQVQGIMTFKEIEKQYCTQKTNEALLRVMFGDDPMAIVGKRVTFRPGKTRGKGGVVVDAIRVAGSPDMTVSQIEHTVEYAEKSMRKPETFTLARTKIGADQEQKKEPPTVAKSPGDITQARTILDSAMPDTVDFLIKPFRDNYTWTSDEGKEIKKRIEEVKSTTVKVSEE
jgi:hypothetical protein